MPWHFYHLKFELYPNSTPTASLIPTASGSPRGPLRGTDFHKTTNATYKSANPSIGTSTAIHKASPTESIWLPSQSTNIFGNLPSHPRSTPRRPALLLAQKYTRDTSDSSLSSGSSPSPGAATSGKETSSGQATPAVIDCGPSRAPVKDESNIVRLTERQWRQRTKSFPPPPVSAAIRPQTAVRDWRFGKLSIESVDLRQDNSQQDRGNDKEVQPSGGGEMAAEGSSSSAAAAMSSAAAPGVGPTFGGAGAATKATYAPLETKNTEIGWGIVHFYREGDETPSLHLPPRTLQGESAGGEAEGNAPAASDAEPEEDCTTLCIPAVPSYLTPADFLGFVGEKWRDDVSHYRMVMTAKMNRYLVLMKFREGRRAREWRDEFDGKVFNSMESQVCHVVFVKSITFETPTRPSGTFPDLSHDPFTPSSSAAASSSLKPFPPPTPSLIELPTCPVCLERMDDTTGLMTIPCHHVFHCTCLQNWKGSGCPVCRHTNPEDPTNPYSQPFGSGVSNLCSTCDSTEDLWICLICGNVGCGRYKGGHAKDHWKETAHSFALELETQHVWDYAGDMWVHRLIRDKGDGKVVELPARSSSGPSHLRGPDGSEDDDVVPRAKLENIGLEYTHLLASQLESQRVYFEEMLSKVADKAAKASSIADTASNQASTAIERVTALEVENESLKGEVIPQLERQGERETTKAAKAQELARSLGKSLQEEKKVSEGLLKRVEHVNGEMELLRKRMHELMQENEELKETNRDLTMFISGQEKLKELEAEGKVHEGELAEGSVVVPEKEKKGKRRGRK